MHRALGVVDRRNGEKERRTMRRKCYIRVQSGQRAEGRLKSGRGREKEDGARAKVLAAVVVE
jgi:hypothetical protein